MPIFPSGDLDIASLAPFTVYATRTLLPPSVVSLVLTLTFKNSRAEPDILRGTTTRDVYVYPSPTIFLKIKLAV